MAHVQAVTATCRPGKPFEKGQQLVQSFAHPSKGAKALENVFLFNPDQKELLGRRKVMREIEMNVMAPFALSLAPTHEFPHAIPQRHRAHA